MSGESNPTLATAAEALYAALAGRYGLVVRGDLAALQKARARLVKEDDAMAQVSVLGPDPEGRLWLVRKDKLGAAG